MMVKHRGERGWRACAAVAVRREMLRKREHVGPGQPGMFLLGYPPTLWASTAKELAASQPWAQESVLGRHHDAEAAPCRGYILHPALFHDDLLHRFLDNMELRST